MLCSCGIEYGGETWGANALDASSKVLDYSSCSMACNGNSLQLCGGSSAMDLYITSGAATSSVVSSAASATSTKAATSSAATVAVPSAVYTSPAPAPTGASVVQTVGQWTHTSCYSDAGNPRTLPNGVTNSAKTVEGGLAACQAKGYK